MSSFDVVWNIFTSFLDVFSVTIIVYVVLKLLSKSKQNVLILLALLAYAILYVVAHTLGLKTLSFIMAQVYSWGLIIIVILFQNEIRSSIDKFFSSWSFFSNKKTHQRGFLDSFVLEVRELANRKIGALIAFEMDVNLSQYKKNAISINGDFSKYLLECIFLKDSPLHDGAVIIKNQKIDCASAYFPISVDLDLDQKYGTRHRAGVTVSNETDAIVVIVSEETGHVSIAYRGDLIDNVDNEFLTNFIKEKMEEAS